jgi:hypothetical protein
VLIISRFIPEKEGLFNTRSPLLCDTLYLNSRGDIRMRKLLKRIHSHYRAIKNSARICKVLLYDQKYIASIKNGEYRDREGNYLPWFTFPAIEALKNWDLSNKRVFEYGSGFSTLFWAARAKEVVSVEHNPAWHERVLELAPENTRIILSPITQGEHENQPRPETREQFRKYAEAIREYGKFDVIVLDGYARSRVRYQCARAALTQLLSSGLVILDNSDWLPATAMYLRQAGLIEVDLSGPVPGNEFYQTTSIFFTRDFDFKPAGERQPLAPVGGRIDNWEAALEEELLSTLEEK